MEVNKPILRLLCGCPGSGKSTCAKALEGLGYVILSSDAMRLELYGDENYQTHNDVVFETLYQRAKVLLQAGKNIVIDATNNTMKSRRKALGHFQGMDIYRTCTVICTPIELVLKNDANRSRHVGPEVVWAYIKSFEIPIREEGFDEISYQYGPSKELYSLAGLFEKTLEFDQNNPHHSMTLGMHCLATYNTAKNDLAGLSDYSDAVKLDMQQAAFYHDIGKLFVQTTDDAGISHYRNHHNVGAYVCMCSNEFKQGIISPRTIFLINHHMEPYFWKLPSTIEKYRRLWGEKLLNLVLKLHEYDLNSH